MRYAALVIAVALAAGAAGPASAQSCDFCPSGLAVAPGTEVPSSGGETCGSLLEAAPDIEPDEYTCTVAKMAEELCCPASGDGDDDGGDEDGTDNGTDDGTDDDPDTDDNDDGSNGGTSGGAEKPCPVCPQGLTVPGSTVIGQSGGRTFTCEGLIVDALQEEEDSRTCTSMLRTQRVCCPPGGDNENEDGEDEDDTDAAGGAEKPCPVCPNGLTVPDSTVIGRSGGRTFTCGALVVDALEEEEGSRTCANMLAAQRACCPPGEEDEDEPEEPDATPATGTSEDDEDAEADESCPVCSNGITVDADTVINESGGRVFTCGGLIVDALQVDKDSDICAAMLRTERLCCPPDEDDEDEPAPTPVTSEDEDDEDTGADNPCPVCPSGITVPGETVINEFGGRTFTCGGLIVDALQEEEDSRICEGMLTAQGLCCPPNDDEEEVEDEDEAEDKDEDEPEATPAPPNDDEEEGDRDEDEGEDELEVEDEDENEAEDKDEDEPEATPAPSPAPQMNAPAGPMEVESPDVPTRVPTTDPDTPPTPAALTTAAPTTGAPFAFGFPSPTAPDMPNTESPFAVTFDFVGGFDDAEDTPMPTPAPSDEETRRPSLGPDVGKLEDVPASEPATLDEGPSSAGVRTASAGAVATSVISVAYALCI